MAAPFPAGARIPSDIRTSVRITVLNPSQIGAIAEAVIAAEAVKAGVRVWRPLVEGGRADLLFEFDGRFARIQCKTGARRGDVVIVPTRTSRRVAGGHRRTTYDVSEVDAIAAYCADTNGCYLVPIEAVGKRGNVYLRLAPARNNQEFAISYAARLRLPWGHSSAGRARDWQSRGRGFEPPWLHRLQGRPDRAAFSFADSLLSASGSGTSVRSSGLASTTEAR